MIIGWISARSKIANRFRFWGNPEKAIKITVELAFRLELNQYSLLYRAYGNISILNIKKSWW